MTVISCRDADLNATSQQSVYSEGVGWNLRRRRSEEGRPLIDEAAYEHTTLRNFGRHRYVRLYVKCPLLSPTTHKRCENPSKSCKKTK